MKSQPNLKYSNLVELPNDDSEETKIQPPHDDFAGEPYTVTAACSQGAAKHCKSIEPSFLALQAAMALT